MSEVGSGLKAGVKPRAAKTGPAAGGVVAGIIGCIWAFIAACMAAAMLFSDPIRTADAIGAVLSLLSAAVAIPPVMKWLRARAAITRPTFVPPVLAVALAAMAANVGGPAVRVPSLQTSGTRQEAKLTPEQSVEMAHAALREGDHDRALALLTALPQKEQTNNPLVVSVMKGAFAQSKAAEYPNQVRTYILPEIAALKVPDQAEELPALWAVIEKFEALARDLDEAKALPLDEAGSAARSQALAALSRKQVELFPALRRLWREKAAHTFWLMDVGVAVSGSRSEVVTWTGGIFAANANIAQSQASFVENTSKLRFQKSRYRWFSAADRISTYDMKPPADEQVGYWNGRAFRTVE